MRSLFFSALFAVAAAAPAHASYIIGDPVGPQNANGSVDFFIPLKASTSGSYGSGKGQSQDSCYVGYATCGGYLDMRLSFDVPHTGTGTLFLFFEDLDLNGLHDPWYFRETVSVKTSSGETFGPITSETSPYVSGNSTDYYQLLTFNVNVGTDPFYVDLHFTSKFKYDTPKGKYYNTKERLFAKLKVEPKQVPEPGMLSLLGGGLFAIGLLGLRRRRAAA